MLQEKTPLQRKTQSGSASKGRGERAAAEARGERRECASGVASVCLDDEERE